MCTTKWETYPHPMHHKPSTYSPHITLLTLLRFGRMLFDIFELYDLDLWLYPWPWPWIFKVKFWNSCISGTNGLINVKQKGSGVIEQTVGKLRDLDFNLIIDLHFKISRWNFEMAVSWVWVVRVMWNEMEVNKLYAGPTTSPQYFATPMTWTLDCQSQILKKTYFMNEQAFGMGRNGCESISHGHEPGLWMVTDGWLGVANGELGTSDVGVPRAHLVSYVVNRIRLGRLLLTYNPPVLCSASAMLITSTHCVIWLVIHAIIIVGGNAIWPRWIKHSLSWK